MRFSIPHLCYTTHYMLHIVPKRAIHGIFTPVHTLYVLNFLLGIHIGLVVFFNASFLESKHIPAQWLGIIFILGSLLSIFVYYTLPQILQAIGLYRILLITTIIEGVLFLGLAYVHTAALVLLCFIASLAVSLILFYGLDILLEAYTKNENDTGNGRSSFLTIVNIAYLVSPFIAGVVISHFGFPTLYTIAALILIPFFILVRRTFTHFHNPHYHPFRLHMALRTIVTNADLRTIYIVRLVLQFFYAWMVIYTPIYLHQHIGFSLSAIGILFSVMLLPFTVLEWPLGHYADKWYGEKEFLMAGFMIMALSTYALSFITTADFALWMLLLFITRIGAAQVEVMHEIYFFKHVDGADADAISAFRMLYPIAYILGPLLGALTLTFLPMQYMFGILGMLMLIGFVASAMLKDTK